MFLGAGRASAVHQNGLFELDGDAFNDPALPGDDWSSVNLGLPGGYFSHVFVPFSVEGPAVDKTFFTGGGSKDTNDLSQWNWSTNDVAPDKDQLTNTYAASYVDGGGHTIVNFGADRSDTSGDANVGFWFFQSPVSLSANGTFSGLHSDGDVFVVSAFTNGGSAPNIDVYKWQAGALVKLTSGQTCTPGDTACAYVNSGPIPVSWFYLDKDGDPGSIVPTSGFFEGGIDLNSLFAGGKIPCFSNFLAETRSSQAPNAQLKDLAIGAVDSCGTITIHKSATPKSAQSFGFTAGGADPKVSSFSLVDNGDSAASTKTFESINAGAYSVSENQPPADWDFDHISCSTTGNGTTATPSGRSLSINLGAGGSADCTYYNVRKPSLTVTKSVVPASDTGSFGLQIDGQTKATGGNGTTTGAVLVGVGAHTVSELGANGTALGNYSAVYGGDCDASGHVTLAAGEAKACTITNTRIPTLTVQKVLLPAADTGTFGLQIDGQTKATGGNGATTGAVLSTIGAHTRRRGRRGRHRSGSLRVVDRRRLCRERQRHTGTGRQQGLRDHEPQEAHSDGDEGARAGERSRHVRAPDRRADQGNRRQRHHDGPGRALERPPYRRGSRSRLDRPRQLRLVDRRRLPGRRLRVARVRREQDVHDHEHAEGTPVRDQEGRQRQRRHRGAVRLHPGGQRD